MSSSQQPKVLDSLSARIRRFQFTVGLGFLALVLGRLVSGSLLGRLMNRVEDLPLALQAPAAVVLAHFWLVGMLPVLCYAAALVLELKPLTTALGAAATGALFLSAILAVSQGVAGIWDGPAVALLQVAVFAAGVLLSYRAVLAGRAVAAQRAGKALAQAEARKGEYESFLREAERGAEKTAQREAAAVAAAAAPGQGGVDAAAPAPGASQEPAAPGAEPSPEPKAPSGS